MTTFKTFAIAAMMAVFGATTAFANNNVNKNHRVMPTPPPPVHATAARHNHHHAGCKCRNCEEMRYRMEMERLHKMTEGAVRGCNCHKCEAARHKMNHKPARPVGPARR